MNEVIKLLTEKNKTISTMESCTGGGIANAITNIEGSSEVFKFVSNKYSYSITNTRLSIYNS
jgi:nicotinamide mononucleotide (NMN) deamidase PncC